MVWWLALFRVLFGYTAVMVAWGAEMVREQPPEFGGDWTRKKLSAVGRYLEAYTTALKRTSFRTIYIDAFAGTGRIARRNPRGNLFEDLTGEGPWQWLDGSARIALKNELRFGKYIFIERDEGRCRELNGLRNEFPHLAQDIEIQQCDANVALRRICQKTDWRSHRAVAFLDPYGLQVDWETVKAIAGTKAIDLWLLFPLGVAVNRMLKRSGDIPEAWQQKLTQLLGTEDWYDAFYRVETERSLFGDNQERVVKASTESIGRYFNNRLKEIFADAADPPGVLRNSTNNPLYLLCFAVANERGKGPALRIANHLLRAPR